MKFEVLVKFHQNYLEVEGNRIRIGITVVPEKGKANAEIIKKLAKHFKVSQSKVKIILGKTSNKKVVEIED